MRITVLVENTSDGRLLCEHGLSLLIEYEGKNILLDAGSTDAFYCNGRTLGISLEQIDACVLSHGHYDHSGGLEALFQNNRDVKVYAQKSAINQYYFGNDGTCEIGIPERVLAFEDRFELIEGNKEIFPGVWVISHSTKGLEQIGEKTKLYKKVQGKIVPDDFSHEQSLVFAVKQGLVIFNSCSHGGVSNIIREVKGFCGNENIYAYIGGLHMKEKVDGEEVCGFSDEEVDALCNVIREEKLQVIYTGHCTGILGLKKMQERLGDRVRPLITGLQFEL